ncbi:MAG: alkaline phosphatase family protein [Bacteroidota bacterium]
MFRFFFAISLVLLLLSCETPTVEEAPTPPNRYKGQERVIVLGFSGLTPDGILNAPTPNFERVMKNAAISLSSRAVLRTSSGPNWASLLNGAGPEQHGITSDTWKKDEHSIPAMVQNERGWFPSIFQLIRDQRPTAKQGAVYQNPLFGQLFDPELVDLSENTANEEATVEKALQFIIDEGPECTVIELAHIETAAKTFGYTSKEYYESVTKADSLLGVLLRTLQGEDMLQSSLLILASNHGGIGLSNGGETLQEMEIPLILFGPGVKAGYEMQVPVNITDYAPTIAWSMNLEIPYAWTGRAIKTAFFGETVPMLSYSPKVTFAKPLILPMEEGLLPAGGLFVDTVPKLQMRNPNMIGMIRYTLDGSTPTSVANIFGPGEEVMIERNTVVKAAIFSGVTKMSRDAIGYFRILQKDEQHGVQAQFYQFAEPHTITNLDSLSPTQTQRLDELRVPEELLASKRPNLVRMTTYLEIQEAGNYTLWTKSEGPSELIINGTKIVNQSENEGMQEASGNLDLEAGRHELQAIWSGARMGAWFDAYIEGPAMPKQIIPADRLYLERN